MTKNIELVCFQLLSHRSCETRSIYDTFEEFVKHSFVILPL